MTFRIQVDGFRCNEETDGTGSDEIVFLMAALPVDKAGFWTYADRERHFRMRWATNIDTDDVHTFEHPIQITLEEDPSHALEIHFRLLEIDGRESTKSQAVKEERDWKALFATGQFAPGAQVGGPGRVGWARRAGSSAGFANDKLAIDVWTIDLEAPLAGMLEPGFSLWSAFTGTSIPVTAPDSGADAVYPNARPDGSLLETRTYRHEDEDARYTFDVSYALT